MSLNKRRENGYTADLHILHIVANFISVFLFQKDPFTTKSLYLGLSLLLLNESNFGRARGPSGESICRQKWRFVGLRDAMWRRPFLGIN
jgi:hypothetical protein